MADFQKESDLFFRGGINTRMLWVYGLGERDYSLCLPGDVFCPGTTSYYNMDASIENDGHMNKMKVCVFLYFPPKYRNRPGVYFDVNW